MKACSKLLSLAAALFLVSCQKPDNSAPPGYPKKAVTAASEQAECTQFVAKLPADVVRGSIEVPEDYANPSGPKIHVFYYGHVGTSAHPTIAFFNGGPAASSHSSYDSMNPIFTSDTLQETYPILYIDQRGTGCSDFYPEAQTPADLVRLSHYGSKEIVLDAEMIRKKIQGDTKWKVFGQSYGGLIVSRYLQVAPSGVVSLHAHGYSVTNDTNLWNAERLQSQNRLTIQYFNENPGDEQVYNQVESLLNDDLCISSTDGKQKKCGKSILYSTTELLGFHVYWKYLHLFLNSFLKDGALDNGALTKYVRMIVFNDSESENGVAGLMVSWVDRGVIGFDRSTCQSAYDILHAKGEKPETWPLQECKYVMNTNLTATDLAQQAELMQLVNAVPKNVLTLDALVSAANLNPQIPFYLYSGGEDGFVPTETFNDEVQALGTRVQYTNFPNSGHEGFLSERQVWLDLLQ